MRKEKLQLFAAPTDSTLSADINITAREIDFVSSFSRDLQSLLDIMGITNMIKKENGTQLKKKKVSGTLKSGAVAEGDEIPYSQYRVTETNAGTLTIKKYKKGQITMMNHMIDGNHVDAMKKTRDDLLDLTNKI